MLPDTAAEPRQLSTEAIVDLVETDRAARPRQHDGRVRRDREAAAR
ncbi:MAG TPA: hypothetical protein VFZ11_10145 [Gemmatimonadaceae bacterium]